MLTIQSLLQPPPFPHKMDCMRIKKIKLGFLEEFLKEFA